MNVHERSASSYQYSTTMLLLIIQQNFHSSTLNSTILRETLWLPGAFLSSLPLLLLPKDYKYIKMQMCGNCQLPFLLAGFYSHSFVRCTFFKSLLAKAKLNTEVFWWKQSSFGVWQTVWPTAGDSQVLRRIQTSPSWCNYRTTGCSSSSNLSERDFSSI